MAWPLQSLTAAALRLGHAGLDAVLPPRCLSCGTQVDRQGAFCAPCWQALDFIGEPLCCRCGTPFAHAAAPGMTCAPCLAQPPAYTAARSVWKHAAGARESVLAFKYADKPQLAASFIPYLLRAGRELLADPDAILIPVPLHRWRLLFRRYNQAAELARYLARASGLTVMPDLLVRVRATHPQQGLTGAQRRDNLRRAFKVREPARLAGRSLILVDDVITTGTTVGACADVLLAAGALKVSALSLTRVVNTA